MIEFVLGMYLKNMELPNIINDPHIVLKQYWGFDSFRGKQLEAINDILHGNDVLFLAPTGLRKISVFIK